MCKSRGIGLTKCGEAGNDTQLPESTKLAEKISQLAALNATKRFYYIPLQNHKYQLNNTHAMYVLNLRSLWLLLFLHIHEIITESSSRRKFLQGLRS